MYNNILLAYDFDNSFNNVPKELENLTAHNDEARVTIFNVIPESDLQASVRYENKHFESLAEEKGFSTGNIKNCLLTEIEQENYDIVVMSNKRAKPDIKNVLGNVTHKIANSANIPVLIVK